MSDSSRNHSDTKPTVGGSPASVSEPTASPNPLHGVRRARPRSSSRSSAPVAASIPADEVNSRDLATVCVTTCSVAASSPAATRRRSPTAAPVSATPNPVTMSPVFSMLE